MAGWVTCPVCGFRFESTPEGACGSCPLHSGCAMACCPACGHTTINTHESRLARWFQRVFGAGGDHGHRAPVPLTVNDLYLEDIPLAEGQHAPGRLTLDRAAPGMSVEVQDFDPALPPRHRLRLQAFGLEPGCVVNVIQQRPVTVVQIDQIELAVEQVLARWIRVGGAGG